MKDKGHKDEKIKKERNSPSEMMATIEANRRKRQVKKKVKKKTLQSVKYSQNSNPLLQGLGQQTKIPRLNRK
mgnify:FL=1|jgi:hypothetical protein|tara:strand:- start:544 stop:759 length:216 start_codon:yes stop_codon:yes gene_type:complete